ncbi:MAG: hypothetical protein K0M45_02310 [Candidatus Paracaedibacteraceae bacterium]|nr:hypothetical protein [Candidatus Paracaedibacteraceae bacterium]
MKSILFAATLLSSSMAATLAVKGPLTEKSAYHLHEVFVQNSGAKLEGAPYTQYNVTLGYITNVDPQDSDQLTKVINRWLEGNRDKVRGMKFRADRAESDAKRVMIAGEHITNEFYCLRDGLRTAVEAAKVPSGRHYTLALNSRGIFVPSIYIGDITGFKPQQVTRTINRRIEQSNIIHNDPYFEVEVDNLKLSQN